MAGDWVRSAVSPGVQAAQPGCGKLVELQGESDGLTLYSVLKFISARYVPPTLASLLRGLVPTATLRSSPDAHGNEA